MADLCWCKRCDAFIYPYTREPHVCPPEWWVWVPEEEDETDGHMVRALDAERAAEKHVEGFDGDSYDQLSGSGFLVHVRASGKVVRVRVTGEATISYMTEIEEDDDG